MPPLRRQWLNVTPCIPTTGVLQEYGTGRLQIPGLADMLADMEGKPKTGETASQSSSDTSSGSSIRGTPALQQPGAAQGPTLSSYLEFGRLMGESPQEVQKRLALADMSLPVDEASVQYMQVGSATQGLRGTAKACWGR